MGEGRERQDVKKRGVLAPISLIAVCLGKDRKDLFNLLKQRIRKNSPFAPPLRKNLKGEWREENSIADGLEKILPALFPR